MEHINKALSQMQKTQAGQKDSTQQQVPSMTSIDREVVNRLFQRLQEIFPKWREIWASQGELNAAKKQWTRTIIRRGITEPKVIEAGLLKAEESGWVRPPSAGQFCDWCIDVAKEKSGIPSKENAVSQIMAVARRGEYARKRTRLCPAIYQMCRFIDWYNFKRMNVEKAEKAAERAYDQMVEHWRAGRAFAEQPTMIEKPKPSGVVTESSREKGKKTIKELMEKLR